MLEKEVERYLCKQVKQAGGWAIKFISPGLSGVPDRIILFPPGKIFFVETKAPGQKLRKLQGFVCDKIKSFGFDVRRIDTKDKVDLFVNEVTPNGRI